MNRLLSSLRKPSLRWYGVGLLCVVAGAGVTGVLGSMWPLALGSSAAVMATAARVRDIRAEAAARRATARRAPTQRP